GADIEPTADEPLGERLVPLEHLVPARHPRERFRLFGPETVGIVLGALKQLLVLGHALDVGVGGELGRRRKGARFLQHTRDVLTGRGHGKLHSWFSRERSTSAGRTSARGTLAAKRKRHFFFCRSFVSMVQMSSPPWPPGRSEAKYRRVPSRVR